MSVTKMTELRNQIDQLLRWEGTKNQKERAIKEMINLYSSFGENILEDDYQRVYSLYDLSTHIFRLAKKEVEENQEKWEKEDKKYRTSLFELSIRHLKTCCRQQIDHNTINWIPYILTILDFQWIQSEGAMENELSRVLLLCSMASQLHWAEHLHVKTLWEFIWKRVEDPQCLDNIMKDYVEVAVEILKNVDTVVFEKSALDLVRTVIGTFKKVVEVDHKKEWSHKRKYSVVYVLSFIVHRWGLEARDFILREIFDLIDYMLSLISVDLNSGESKIYMMHLVDDVIKLSMIETVKSHRTIDEKTEENVRNLVKMAIFESLKSASKMYALSSGFSISDEYIRYLARWILAEIELEGSESMDESFDSSAGKKKEWNEFSLNGLIHLTFGAHSLNQLVAWEGALQILTEVLLTRKLNTHQSEKILTILWEKRKSFHSETLRIAFCQLLSTVIPLDLRFGHRNIPSIDSILKYSLNVIQTLPVAASLTENILRYRSRQVPKAGLQLIWDTVSRTSPGSIEVIRLINALIAFTEFDENSRFANDENVGNWSLRKDVVEWLLADPKANSHLLIFELCQYHPIFCFFDTNQTWNDDQLIQTMRKCSLMKSPVEAKESTRPLDASIQEIVNYVHDKLKSILTSEINLPVFILSYEFSRKFPEVVIDFSRTYQKLSHIVEEMEEEEFLNSVEHLSEWPRDLKLPAHLQNSEPSYMTYLIKNLHNPLIDWTQWIANREKIIEKLIEIARNDRKMREKMRKSIQLNKFIREFIQENAGDPYEMTKRYERFSFLLSDRNLMSVWDGIRTRATKALEEDAIGDPDLFIFEKLISSSFLRNVSTPHILDGSHFDPTTVSIHADHMDFNEKSIKIYLKSLRKSPFLAQNIVRKVLENGDDTWHLHAKMLKNVMKNERLLTICIATIPNMVRYLRIYQIQYPPSSKTTRFLTFAPDPIATCQKYLRKPKENGNSITANNLMLLFGTEKSTWKRAIIRFWRLFESDPALVADRFFEFATESIELGLKHRIVSIMNSLTSSEFSRIKDPELKMIFELTQRAIFVNLTREECSPKLLNMSNDSSFCADFYKNRIAEIPMEYAEEVERFEERIALAVENFLKFGIETASVNYMDFGLTEFYQQLNENLTEKAIKANESRNIYLVDCLSTVWLQLPSMRPNIRPIVARFKGISAAWSRFPQPPHLQPNAEQSFLWRARLQITLKMMSQGKWRRGKFATCCTCLLTSFDGRHLRRDLIEKKEMNRLKRETQRNVLCILSKILKKEIDREEGEAVVAKGFYEAFTMASSVFPDIAAITVPFLFKICVDFKEKYEFAVGKLLACLKGVQKEDEHVVYCLAECVDSIGLDVIARYERVDIDSSPQFGPHWYFVLARLFLKHGYLTHAFAIANVLFDRLSSKKRNLMMIERISLEGIEKPKEMIDLLVEIYVAENNSIALSSLPPDVQNRDDVRQVMDKNSKKWLSLVSSKQLNPRESSLVQWMCGLPPNSSGDKYLDSIIRFDFKQYPKHLDSPMKIVYFTLFHQQIGTVIPPKLVNFTPTIDEMRLILIAQKTIHPESIEEHMIKAVRDLRKTINRREAGELKYARDINLKTARIVKLSEMLTENHAFEAAHLLLKTWEEECLKWNVPSIDIDLIRIYRGFVTGQSWDPRIAEINLRSMQPRVGTMSAVAIAEWASALSKITIEYRNDLEEGIRILELGCRHLQNKDSLEARLQLLLKFHSVCLGQLSKLEEYRETRGYRMKKEVISEFEAQLQNSARLSRGASGDEARRAMQRMRKEQQIEKADVEKVEKLVVSAAQKAVSSAFDALSCISQLKDDEEAIRTSSLIIFPLIDVIYKYEQDPGVINLLKEHATSGAPTKLWLCATSHIASKCFSLDRSPITKHVSSILCQLIYDYPFHVLHTVLMYEYGKNGSVVVNFLKQIMRMHAESKSNTARLKEIVEAMREAHAAYKEIANFDPTRANRIEIDGKSAYEWPLNLRIFRCKLSQLPIPTISQKIGPASDYSSLNLVTWKTPRRTFTIADGLSTPKIWEIEGSDGKLYKTVWKKDDVRQDVLVEQMFDVTNNMLERRMLRTYNVVPLDTECGIIEFCGGTVSLKELLCGANRNGGLHLEFNPDEEPASKIQGKMKQVQAESTETKRHAFREICQEYSPVFRHFFYTNFPTSHIWRQKIIDYRQSLATWSIVCYIVGLGDRHSSNILFDQSKCTFVHIDLGMILEYSKRSLPVPEQVPFRISRDVLDPILIEGIENGQLADECTQIMEKLKENRKVILGVASALLRETMSNFREADEQKGRPSYISEMAIGRLRDKLRGTDDGVTAQSSNLQTRRLLREATNCDNLSRMFSGWLPFL